jgi:hypothetical protein
MSISLATSPSRSGSSATVVRGGLATCRQHIAPDHFAGVDVDGADQVIGCSSDEYQAACRGDRATVARYAEANWKTGWQAERAVRTSGAQRVLPQHFPRVHVDGRDHAERWVVGNFIVARRGKLFDWRQRLAGAAIQNERLATFGRHDKWHCHPVQGNRTGWPESQCRNPRHLCEQSGTPSERYRYARPVQRRRTRLRFLLESA